MCLRKRLNGGMVLLATFLGQESFMRHPDESVPKTSPKELYEKLLRAIVDNTPMPCTELSTGRVSRGFAKGASVEDAVNSMVPGLFIKIVIPSLGNGHKNFKDFSRAVEDFGKQLAEALSDDLAKEPELLKALTIRGIRRVSVTMYKFGKGSAKTLQSVHADVPANADVPAAKKKSAA
jgi:hypothetical protein